MIVGLEDITGGEVVTGDRLVNDLAPRDRNLAMVFQNYALYPHLSVYENIAFPLRRHKTKEEEVRERVEHAAMMLELNELLDRKPSQLSGGCVTPTPSCSTNRCPTSTPSCGARCARSEGDEAELWLDPSRMHLFDPATGENLTHGHGADSRNLESA